MRKSSIILYILLPLVKDRIKGERKFQNCFNSFPIKSNDKDFQLTDFFLHVKLFQYTLSVLKGTCASLIASITLFIDVLPSGHDVTKPSLRKQIKHDEAQCIHGEYISLRYRVITSWRDCPFPATPNDKFTLQTELSVLINQTYLHAK